MSETDQLIARCFQSLKSRNQGAFIPFITAGYPGIEESKQLIIEMAQSGADLIEVGVAFSDPMADGPTIQEASGVALANGISLKKTLDMIHDIRKTGIETPIILMGYANPFLAFGLEDFAIQAKLSGVNGLIVPDLPAMEAKKWKSILSEYQVDLIRFISPTTSEKRAAEILDEAQGFVYCLSVAGITGARGELPDELFLFLKHLKTKTQVPLVVGFGVSQPRHVSQICEVADGAIIASALIDGLKKQDHDEARQQFVRSFVRSMKDATIRGDESPQPKR